MDENLLKQVYSPEDFRKRGHQLIDVLADHLEHTLTEKSAGAIAWNLPEPELDFWSDFLKEGKEELFFPEVLNRTTHTHHPKYVGHQVAAPAPITALTGMVSSLLNNGMAVYEMGMAPSAMERIVTDVLCRKIGYDDRAGGFLTSGGTLANLTALLSARKAKARNDVWNQGHTESLGIMVSEEAHYCVDRAAKIMGLGEKGIIKIPVAHDFSMDVSKLDDCFGKASADGIHVFAIVGSAPSTATGAHDPLEAIAHFASDKGLWFHVDGAHGGAAIYSRKYAYLVQGIEKADSVAIDGHKMMLLPTITTALLFKNKRHAQHTFSQKADYLLNNSDADEWFNSGKKTFECTKTMMSLHWFVLMKCYGERVFDAFVTRQYDLARTFARMIQEAVDFELAIPPSSNILCFRYLNENRTVQEVNTINAEIRGSLLEEGEYYLVQTMLRDRLYLRTTLMNPFTTERHLRKLLKKIQRIARQVQKSSKLGKG